jgi:hypothetical protein
MRTHEPVALAFVSSALAFVLASTTACQPYFTQPSEPGGVARVDRVERLVSSLRAKGITVEMRGETSHQRNGYFSVSSKDLEAGGALLKAFEYDSEAKADADARQIGANGQPNPTAVLDWIAAPHFFKQGPLIVVYFGCSANILLILTDLLGVSIARGSGCH